MARLTRSESQARTRADLIATARDLFLTDGYARTSLDRVAEAAGFSKGAVYSNFRTKKQLCLEVLDLIHETKFGEITTLLAAGTSLDDQLERLQEWAERTLGDVGWTMLEFEFAIVARDDPQLRAELVSSLDAVRGAVAAQVQILADSAGIELPLSAEEAAGAVLSMGIGLGIQRAVDPSLSARLITDAVRMLLTAGTPSTPVRSHG
ncbi:TetR/AcrR family transcriptional regulator [Nocardia cyriacigeorgica]|uniref:TetR/AcrR family transcriptional regulator n=2 Tax=Nocardia cyriacigeorgica TaxID=135487 RepID=A0A6P1D751_9NOCA|nr:TetR/AcrR family transcriptional regulator [Nocardia cyriacigeorgica]NEW41854.1 TetR/AcrR family transcriptional regulator [Nocardia cyriacigeorgica]NEW45898.1 TetR/AcrR family transcriptional regulator [Nocardia cyriacigeorgica]NEW52480.1 TetR/AcrR family transcriptional regulator [Nocardia cyriacigeorgica]NEW56729.1 TetR/AcrR family transcriptional regulator [Nocardia cyriacigeorgica]